MMAGGLGIDPDALAFLTAAGITDATITTAIDTLVIQLKAIGVWAKMKAIYPFVGGTASTHKFNLKNPVDSNAAFRLSFAGGWTHSANGIQGNGANTFANTFYVPNTECNSQNNSIAIYERTNIRQQSFAIGSSNAANSNPFAILTWYFTDLAYYANGNFLFSVSANDSRGFWQGFTNATDEVFYRNSGQLATQSLSVKTLTTQPLYIGCDNTNGVATFVGTRQFAFASMGGTKLTTTEAANYYTAVQAFQTTLNRQV